LCQANANDFIFGDVFMKLIKQTNYFQLLPAIMAPMKTMKAMKAMKSASKVMTKGALVKTLAEQHELKTKVASGLLTSLATLATTEVKTAGKFTIQNMTSQNLVSASSTGLG